MNSGYRFLIVLSFSILNLFVHAQSPGTNRAQWLQSFTSGNLNEALTAVEREVSNPNPDDNAAIAWVTLHKIKGDLDQALARTQGDVKERLKLSADLARFDDEREETKMSELFSFDYMKTHAGMIESYYWIEGTQMINPNAGYDLAIIKLSQLGESFRLAWTIATLARNHMSIFRRVNDDLRAGKLDSFSATKDYLLRTLAEPTARNLNELQYVSDYLAAHPDDGMALRYKAHKLRDLGQHENAAQLYFAAWKINPFYLDGLNLQDAFKAEVKAGRLDEARKKVELYTSIFHPTEQALYNTTLWAAALMNGGDHGAAREVLVKAKEEFSQSAYYNLTFGRLENASKRTAYALRYFEQAYRLGPKNIDYYDELVDSYIANGKSPEALELIARLESARKLPINYYYKKANIFEQASDFNSAFEVRKESIRVFPNSSWHLNNYAYVCSKTDRTKEAQQAILKATELTDPTDWMAGRVFDYVKANEGEAAALRKLLELTKKYPWNESLWKTYVNNQKKDKLVVYKEEMLPNSKEYFFPYRILINEYISNSRWNEAEATVAEGRGALSNPEDLKELAYYESETIRKKGQKQRLDQADIDKALAASRVYASLVGTKDEYWYRDVATFLNSAGERKKSVMYLDSGLKVNPDAKIILSLLRNDLMKEYGSGKLSKAYWDHLQRDPYDASRYVDVVDFHVKWGGSPIAAIILSQKVKEILPDEYDKVKNLEVMAYGKLGDNVKDFEIRYAKENVISASERYIGWYNSSRQAVWKGSAKVEIANTTATATIQFPDGTIAQRQDDVITGKVFMIQIGNAFIKAAYDEWGFLTKMESSNGKRLELTYNANHEISEIKSEDNTHLKIKYNERGKPTFIEQQGIGHLEINYSDLGEVDEVRTFDSTGKEGGTQLSQRISNTFQQLSKMANALQQAHVVSEARLPDLGIEDTQRETLLSKLNSLEAELVDKPNPKKQVTWFAQSVEYARYLKDHTHINADYASECFYLLAQTRQTFIAQKNDKILLYGPQLADLFHDLLMKTRRNGVALEWWGEWIDTQEWLQKEKQGETKLTAYRTAIEKVQDKIKAQPVELLSTSEWLPKSPLQNTGYWKKYPVNTIVKPAYQNGLTVNTLFERSNGDILVGTNKGLLVRHHGYWDHVMFNPLQMQMERKLDNTQIKASSNVQSIAERDNEIWMATADGVLVITGEQYMGKVRRISQLDGLPVNSVDHIATSNGKIYLGTSEGLYVMEGSAFTATAVKQKIKFLRQQLVWNDITMTIEDRLIIGTPVGLWMQDSDALVTLTNQEVDDALYNEYGELHLLKNNSVFRYEDNLLVELYGNIVTTDANQVFGIAQVPVNEGESPDGEFAIAALTDLGMSLYHNQHFEHFALPLKEDLAPKVRAFAGNGRGFSIYTGEEVYVYELDQVKRTDDGKVDDIITSNKLGMTFIARSSGLYYTVHDDPRQELQLIDYVYTSALALDNDHRLIANDGSRIMRYTWSSEENSFQSEELFYADQYQPSDVNWITSGEVKNIVVANDQSIWVATKLSVFHYTGIQEDQPVVDEFNYFRSSEKFPAATHMLYRVLQLPDGRIWVVASNEGHLSYHGVYLRGGLLEWDKAGNQFKLLEVSNNYNARGFNWFITSVTAVQGDKAIVGTLGGFAEYNKGEIRDYYSTGGGIKNSSYDNMYSKYPSLFLGTRGDRLGDMWFFGSAAGVVAYHQGTWFYPDRLNQMLPKDNEYGSYGGRLVNAVATDPKGRVYVGTDLGLLIYDSRGADPVSFLINNGKIEDAFSLQNEMMLQQESVPVIKSIAKNTPSGKIITELESINAEISKLEKLKAENQKQMMGRGSASQRSVSNDSITTLIANRQKQHYELLLKLEKQDPAIHQLLDVKPVEVAALRKNLKPDECLVQYIPTAGKLYVQVLANNRLELREVLVKKDTLMRVSRFVANAIKQKLDMSELRGSLVWLYDQLIRPIENDIFDYRNVMVVPVQSLYYIPFAALVDNSSARQFNYAVDKFNIAYVSSTYLLGLLLKTNVETSDRYLLFGNPDGSLPGAGEEVKAISTVTGKGDVFLNKQATLVNFETNAAKSRIVHLATHGYLNEEAPEQSSILLADKKLTMPQIFNLPLDHTEMIVLSACETGKGLTNGLEYATIARAFANAGAPSVLATLWKVDDLASKDLMVSFYQSFEKSKMRLVSLSDAQRNFIKSHPDQAHPFYWAGFILMGKP